MGKSERNLGKQFLTYRLHSPCDGQLITCQGSLCWVSMLEFPENAFRCCPKLHLYPLLCALGSTFCVWATQTAAPSPNISLLLYLSRACPRDVWTWGMHTRGEHHGVGGNPQGAGSSEEAPGLAERGQSGELPGGGNIYTESRRMSKVWR